MFGDMVVDPLISHVSLKKNRSVTDWFQIVTTEGIEFDNVAAFIHGNQGAYTTGEQRGGCPFQ